MKKLPSKFAGRSYDDNEESRAVSERACYYKNPTREVFVSNTGEKVLPSDPRLEIPIRRLR